MSPPPAEGEALSRAAPYTVQPHQIQKYPGALSEWVSPRVLRIADCRPPLAGAGANAEPAWPLSPYAHEFAKLLSRLGGLPMSVRNGSLPAVGSLPPAPRRCRAPCGIRRDCCDCVAAIVKVGMLAPAARVLRARGGSVPSAPEYGCAGRGTLLPVAARRKQRPSAIPASRPLALRRVVPRLRAEGRRLRRDQMTTAGQHSSHTPAVRWSVALALGSHRNCAVAKAS